MLDARHLLLVLLPTALGQQESAQVAAVDEKSCSSHRECAWIGLWGNCCPTAWGEWLHCCHSSDSESRELPHESLAAVPSDELQVLGGPPIGDASVHFQMAPPHPQPPSSVWDASLRAPRPTNAWWMNLVLEEGGVLGGEPVYPMPYQVAAAPDGLSVSPPGAAWRSR